MNSSLLKLGVLILLTFSQAGCSGRSLYGDFVEEFVAFHDRGPSIRVSIEEVPQIVLDAFHGDSGPRKFEEVRKVGTLPNYQYDFVLPDGTIESFNDQGIPSDAHPFRTHGGLI